MPKLRRQLAKAEKQEAPRGLEVVKGQADSLRQGPASNRPLGKEKEKVKRARAKEKEKERRAKAKEAKGNTRARKVRGRIRKAGYGTQTSSANTWEMDRPAQQGRTVSIPTTSNILMLTGSQREERKAAEAESRRQEAARKTRIKAREAYEA